MNAVFFANRSDFDAKIFFIILSFFNFIRKAYLNQITLEKLMILKFYILKKVFCVEALSQSFPITVYTPAHHYKI